MKLEHLNSLSTEQIYIWEPEAFNDPYNLKIDIENLTDRNPYNNDELLHEAFDKLFVGNPAISNFWYYDEGFITTLQGWIDGHDHFPM